MDRVTKHEMVIMVAGTFFKSGQLACSLAGADPQIIKPGMGGVLRLTDVLIVIYSLFTESFN